METTSGSDFDYPVVEGIGFVDKGVLTFGNFDLKLEYVWEDFRTIFPDASQCQYPYPQGGGQVLRQQTILE